MPVAAQAPPSTRQMAATVSSVAPAPPRWRRDHRAKQAVLAQRARRLRPGSARRGPPHRHAWRRRRRQPGRRRSGRRGPSVRNAAPPPPPPPPPPPFFFFFFFFFFLPGPPRPEWGSSRSLLQLLRAAAASEFTLLEELAGQHVGSGISMLNAFSRASITCTVASDDRPAW